MKALSYFPLAVFLALGIPHPAAQAAPKERFLVTYVKSGTSCFVPLTVITVVNYSAVSCLVRVKYYGGTPAEPGCKSSTLLAPGGFCTRMVSGEFKLVDCNVTCSPDLTLEGYAVVLSDDLPGCEKLGVDARVFLATPGNVCDTGNDFQTSWVVSNSRVITLK